MAPPLKGSMIISNEKTQALHREDRAYPNCPIKNSLEISLINLKEISGKA